MAFRWDLNEHVPEGVIRLVSEEVDYAIVQLGNDANDRDEAVHEARKSLKKIRAIMRLIRYEIGEDTYQQQNAFYRDLGRMLAPLRDAFVVTQTMEDVAETLTDKSDQDIAQAIRADLETTYQLTRSAFWESGEAVAQVLQQLEVERPHIQNLPIRHDNFKAFQKGLGRIYRQGQKQMHDAYATIPSPIGFHEWRKRVKYLWYHMRILQPINPEKMDVIVSQLDDLSDVLGESHDLAVLYDRIENHPLTKHGTGRKLLAHLDYRRGQLESAAYPIAQEVYEKNKKAFVKQIGQWWKEREPMRA